VLVLVLGMQDAPRKVRPLHPAPHEVDWSQPVPLPPREQPPLGSEEEVQVRYDRAKTLVRAGNHDLALEEFVWLWTATDNKASPWEPRIRPRIIASIGRLAERHEPTRIRFTAILDEIDAFIRKDPTQAVREWTDWAALSRALNQEGRLVTLYEERRAPDGSLQRFAPMSKERLLWLKGGPPPSTGGVVFHPYAFDDLFDVLVEAERFADAGRIHKDLPAEAASKLNSSDRALDEVREHLSEEDIAEGWQQLREDLALLYALGLAAAREEDSEKVAATLIERFDDSASRRALVLACRRVKVTSPSVQRWMGELRDRGADVSDLEAAPVAEPAASR